MITCFCFVLTAIEFEDEVQLHIDNFTNIFVRVGYKMAAADKEIIVEFKHNTFVTVRDVLERFQKKHYTSTLVLLNEYGRVLDEEQFVENARTYTLVCKPKW